MSNGIGSMHKSEEEFIFNWMSNLRSLREQRTNRIVRCRRLTTLSGEGNGSGNGSGSDAASVSVKKRVHFVRHGEGHHNVHSKVWFDSGKGGNPWEHPTCPIDPTLTEVGVQQAEELNLKCQKEFKDIKPGLLIVSPLRRTLQTATIGFNYLIDQVDFVAHEDCREIMGQHRCDKRLTAHHLTSRFPHVNFSKLADFDETPSAAATGTDVKNTETGTETETERERALEKISVEEEEALSKKDVVFNKWGKKRESDQAALNRALDFLHWLKDLPQDDLIVVTHSAWLCVAFNGALHCDHGNKDLQSWFCTGEIRSTELEFMQ